MSETIQVRTSKAEKETIVKLAQESGLTISEFMRKSALGNSRLASENGLRQKLIPKLCELSDLCSLVENPQVRSSLKKWRHDVWSFLK